MVYIAPLEDMRFVLFDLLQADHQWQRLPFFAERIDSDTAQAMMAEAARIAVEQIAPLNRSGDEEGARWHEGRVSTATGFVEAYRIWREGGFAALTGNPDYEGLGMPKSLATLVEEMLFSANNAFALFPALSAGACLAIDAHATPELKQRFLPKLYAGEWCGTMCLTEPQAGSDLGLIRTRAEPQPDGTYTITGTKIFITGGDHDLTPNIIHLVLAKLPDAPAGSRGISLFLVPKFSLNADGSPGAANGVSCGSIEHKMGIKASPTCVMNFDNATGFLVGEVNRGLNCMFTMMNCERLSIGLQGIGTAEASYQNAVAYARERLQGRDAGHPDKSRAADPILGHADVRRMLMTMRATTEAGRALALYLAMQLDEASHGATPEARLQADVRSALLIPVAKAFFTDLGFESAVLGQQVFGGHGYIREWGQEQLVRDTRIAQIYEGTNGIQAMDLVQRKVFADAGQAMNQFLDEISELTATLAIADLQPVATALKQRVEQLRQLTLWLLEQGRQSPHGLGAAACDYLQVVGYVAYGWMWLRMMQVAHGQETALARNKQVMGNYFFSRLLPRVEGLIACLYAGNEDVMALDADAF